MTIDEMLKAAEPVSRYLPTAGVDYINRLVKALRESTAREEQLAEQVRLLTEQRDAVVMESLALKDALEYVINPDNQPEYHDQGMGCGVEDHGYQRNGYAACSYGWESAMERVYSEVIPDALPETPVTSSAIAALRAEVLPPNIAEIIDSGDLETICYESERSYAEDFRLSLYNFRQLRESKGANHE
ncbi:hypothetical protein [Phytobacter sp. RSE-02]|uniref:hypothetical protein n=1 Tax=Phytobacter sp. RSE-02 TaxID=3229229 RepID=UPI00339D722D